MEIPFKPIELSDKKWIEELLSYSDFRGSEYTFTNNYNWSKVYELDVARYGDFIVYLMGRSERSSYLFPAGRGDLGQVLSQLMEDAQSRGEAFRLHGIQPNQIVLIDELFPGKFVYETNEGSSDYIYLVEKLQTLSGKKLHAKRNHINRFRQNYPDWSYEAISSDNLDEVREMSRQWCKENDCEAGGSLADEACAVKCALNNFEALELSGGFIRAGGRIVAFSFGHRISSDTFGVHVEKAFADVQGAYTMINQQFAIHVMDGFTYANREEDMGDEGLRQAKHSYYPEFMYERYRAKYVD